MSTSRPGGSWWRRVSRVPANLSRGRPLQLDVFTLVPHAFAWLTEQRPVAAVLGDGLDLRLFSYRDYTPLKAARDGGSCGQRGRTRVDRKYRWRPMHRRPRGRRPMSGLSKGIERAEARLKWDPSPLGAPPSDRCDIGCMR